MPEPIPDTAPANVPTDPAASALITLITLLYTDPLAEPLTDAPGFFLHIGHLSIRYSRKQVGVRQMEAARSLFGGDVTDEDTHYAGEIRQRLTTTWQGCRLDVYVDVPREDEVAELRKQLAELRAATGEDVAQ